MRRLLQLPRRGVAMPSPPLACLWSASASTEACPAADEQAKAKAGVAVSATVTAGDVEMLLKKDRPIAVPVNLVAFLSSAASILLKQTSSDAVHQIAVAGEKADVIPEASAASPADGKGEVKPKISHAIQPMRLLLAISSYIRREATLETLCRSKVLSVRRRYVMLRASCPRLSQSQRDVLLLEATRIVERRELPLTVSTRLLRPRWPEYFMDVVGSRHHSFLQRSILAWVTGLLQEKKLIAQDAREVLSHCPRLFNGHVALMGSVVECALSDIATLHNPEPLIQLMWSVNEAGTHAPHHFWRRTLDKLMQLNRSLRDQVGHAIQVEKDYTEKNVARGAKGSGGGGDGGGDTPCASVGHVFSGLTTRQLFRVLRVLRKERWCGDVAAVFDFVDKALKNIAFEAEAQVPANGKTRERQLSKQGVARRVRKTSDLSPPELLSLLSIAGELGVDFHVSMAPVTHYLLIPMVQYLNREQFMLLTVCVRKSRCDSAPLVQTIIDAIVHRGVTYPSTLLLSKAALRTALQKTSLLSQLMLTPFVDHLFALCEKYRWSMRASQLLGWVELLYALSRRYAPSSSVGVRVRASVESFAEPLSVMLASGVVPTSIISRVLEHTVILGMRHNPQYPLTAKLREERNSIVNERNAKTLLQDGDATTPAREVPLSVQQVYDEFVYAYERQMVLRVPLSHLEEKRIEETLSRIGLYSLFMGANIMRRVHLHHGGAPSPSLSVLPTTTTTTATPPSQTLSVWMERRVHLMVDMRIRKAKVSPASTDDTLLRVLGQQSCDAVKVRRFQELVLSAPLLLTRQQRGLWEYIRELARRYGGRDEQELAQQMLAKALY